VTQKFDVMNLSFSILYLCT